jgi:hypothetical protein
VADQAVGNYFTEAIVPAVWREDPRYYTLGHGGFLKRTGYAVSRLLVTRTDSGRRTINISEIVGNGAGAGISDFIRLILSLQRADLDEDRPKVGHANRPGWSLQHRQRVLAGRQSSYLPWEVLIKSSSLKACQYSGENAKPLAALLLPFNALTA